MAKKRIAKRQGTKSSELKKGSVQRRGRSNDSIVDMMTSRGIESRAGKVKTLS